MIKFRREKAIGPSGFTRWVHPTTEKYFLACCDCGLVHELQFKAVEVAAVRGGTIAGKSLPRTTHGVVFRARRADGYTRAQRKKRGGMDRPRAGR